MVDGLEWVWMGFVPFCSFAKRACKVVQVSFGHVLDVACLAVARAPSVDVEAHLLCGHYLNISCAVLEATTGLRA